jgi:lipopolysaccharide biosynthesis regulator YciM
MLQYLFLLLPVAATCGWVFGRRGKTDELAKPVLGRMRPNFRKDYFRGLNYLINEEPDKAVDVFVRLLEVDTDTVETHLALGSLFRRKGEVDRAIRIHQNLIARPQLAKEYRLEALSELGQDYLSAGVLDRAERIFLELVDSGGKQPSSLHFLLTIYQLEKDWAKAIKITQKLQSSGVAMHKVIAQYYCELAEQAASRRDTTEVMNYLKKANSVDHVCVRANMIQARMEMMVGRYKEAIRCYKRIVEQDADYLPEIIEQMVLCFRELNDEERLTAVLRKWLDQYPRISLVLALSDHLRRRHGDKVAMEFIAGQIQEHPSLRGLYHLSMMYVHNSHGDAKEKLTILQDFLNRWLQDKPVYQCSQCGLSGKTLFWMCPSCHSWNTVKPIKGLEGS